MLVERVPALTTDRALCPHCIPQSGCYSYVDLLYALVGSCRGSTAAIDGGFCTEPGSTYGGRFSELSLPQRRRSRSVDKTIPQGHLHLTTGAPSQLVLPCSGHAQIAVHTDALGYQHVGFAVVRCVASSLSRHLFF